MNNNAIPKPGTYDFDTLISRKDTASLKWDKYRNTDVLPFWVADMDFAIAPEIQIALSQRMQHPIYGYTSAPDGLVEALSAHLTSLYQWDIQPDWLVWVPGVVTALSACTRAYLVPGDQLMTNTPIYHHFFQVHNAAENELLRVPLQKKDDRWTYDLTAIEAALTDKTRMLMLCSPHNPTGTVFLEEELTAICALAAKHGTLVISDEIHCGLVLPGAPQHIPTALAVPEYSDSIVTLMSQSKTYNLAGLNCSFAIIPNEDLREKFRQACVEVVPFVSTFAFESALAAFRDGEPWRQSLLVYLKSNYTALATEIDAIPGLKVERCDATYLAWIDATELAGSKNIENTQLFFEQHGVGLSGGEQFGQQHFLRFNFACPRSTLEEGIRRMKKAVASLSS